jgi:hypothetical protein
MTTKERLGFVSLGFLIWLAGTLLYRWIGSVLFEGTATEYWLNVICTGISFAAVGFALMKWRKIAPKDWLQAAICLALPGMVGEVPILSAFDTLMSNMQPETAGRYAAFLFAGYAALLGSTGWMASRVSAPAKIKQYVSTEN